jgi:uncharacterized protein
MGMQPSEQIQPLSAGESFSFTCAPDLSCFTECCRSLDLALTPYDVLRLRRGLKLDSVTFLEQYAVVEESADEAFPLVFLAMIDDGRASCPFVSATGCTVYEDRPAACRAYPLGRGLRLAGCGAGQLQELFVLVREQHCRGFVAGQATSPADWMEQQGLEPYNQFSNALLALLRHRRLQQGWQPTAAQREEYLQTLYQLEDFQEKVRSGVITPPVPDNPATADDDYDLLLAAITWLNQTWHR